MSSCYATTSSLKQGATTAIRGKEFKLFDNLTTRWIKTSKLGQLLWFTHIDDDSERKFPMEAHKIYANKIARGLISEGIYSIASGGGSKKKLPMMSLMI
jgi:hypothetical protein